MASEVVKVVDPDSGTGYDYVSLSSWNSNEQGDLTGVRDEIAIAKCRCTGGTADGTPVYISGWVTSTTQYIKVWTDPAESYRSTDGTWQTGNKYRLVPTSSDDSISIAASHHIRIIGLQIKAYNSDNRDTIQTNSIVETYISKCILEGSGNNYSAGVRCNSDDHVMYISNNVIYDFSGTNCYGINGGGGPADQVYAYNNTIHNCTIGIHCSWDQITAKNNVVNDCADCFGTMVQANNTHNVINVNISDAAEGATHATGTATSYTANKLNDSGGGLSSAQVNSIVKNVTDTTYASVTVVDSDTQLTLSSDIFDNGNEEYEVFTNMFGSVVFEGEGSDNFQLDSSDTVALNKGTNLSSDPYLPFAIDIIEITRPQGAVWDVGAFELITALIVTPSALSAVGAVVIPTVIIAVTIGPANGELAFGEETPTEGETPVEWSTFTDGAGGSPEVIGNADWGKVAVESGEVAHSLIYDLATSVERTITLTRDVYGTGAGAPTIQIRGHDTIPFSQDAGSPSWEAYSVPVLKTWRFIQVRIIYSS